MRAKIFAAVLLSLASSAFAGFVQGTFWCDFPGDPCQMLHTWSFDYATEHLVLQENIYSLGMDQVLMSTQTDSDPIFHITKTVDNGTSFEWTAYELLLGLSGAAFVGSPLSDHFSSAVIENGGLKITYDGSGSVLPGETVVFDFDVYVPTTGPINMCLTQNPIPEPATLLLLGLGAAAFKRRR